MAAVADVLCMVHIIDDARCAGKLKAGQSRANAFRRIASKKIEPKEKSQFRLLRAQIVVASK